MSEPLDLDAIEARADFVYSLPISAWGFDEEHVRALITEVRRLRAENTDLLEGIAVEHGWDVDEWRKSQPAIDAFIKAIAAPG